MNLGELRLAVGQRCGEVLVCTATADGAADGSTFVDADNLFVDKDSYAGAIAVVASSANAENAGQRRRVSGNTKSTTTLTLTRAFPAQLRAGDAVEIYGIDDQNPTPDEIDAAIGRALAAVDDAWWTYDLGDPAAFARTAPTLHADAGYRRLAGAQYEDRDGVWRDVPEVYLLVDETDRTVTLDGQARLLCDGRRVRLRYAVPPARPTDDGDEAPVDPEWLSLEAASQTMFALARRLAEPDSTQAMTQATQLHNDAVLARPKARRRRPAKTWRLQ